MRNQNEEEMEDQDKATHEEAVTKETRITEEQYQEEGIRVKRQWRKTGLGGTGSAGERTAHLVGMLWLAFVCSTITASGLAAKSVSRSKSRSWSTPARDKTYLENVK